MIKAPLTVFVKGLIPDDSGSGDGITERNLNGDGYVKFGNGLMFQWGICAINKDTEIEIKDIYDGQQTVVGAINSVKFPISFPSKCLNVIARPLFSSTFISRKLCDFIFLVHPDKLTASGFEYAYIQGGELTNEQIEYYAKISYFAVGV